MLTRRARYIGILIKEPGYIYVFLSNEETSPVEVYFDDFKVTHVKSPVIQTEDYYPFGLAFNTYQRENSLKNQYQYNGKEKQDELDLGWLDYGARNYMPEIGRFSSTDPHLEKYEVISPYAYTFNNPIRFVDVNGTDPGDFVAVFTGATISVESNTSTHKQIVRGIELRANGGTVSSYKSWHSQNAFEGHGAHYMDAVTQAAFDDIVRNHKENPDGKRY